MEPSTALAWSAGLFVAHGAIHVVIGVLAGILHDARVTEPFIIQSPRTDRLLYGREPAEIIATNLELVRVRSFLTIWLGALLTAYGLLVIAVAWFALRVGAAWALLALVASGLLMAPFWWAMWRPYSRAGIRIGLRDTQPVIWAPALLLVPASALGAWALL